jgi:hypothetical protein
MRPVRAVSGGIGMPRLGKKWHSATTEDAECHLKILGAGNARIAYAVVGRRPE